MERLHQCSDLQQRLEQELAILRTPMVTQTQSQHVLVRIARTLGISTAVANLFVLPQALTIPEYLLYVRERVAEFAPLDIQATLDKAEADAFSTTLPPNFGTMASQLSQWQQDNGVAVPRKHVSISDGDDDDDDVVDPVANGEVDDNSDDEDDGDNTPPLPLRPRNDDDSEDEEEPQVPQTTDTSNVNASELCEQLLQDPVKLSDFTRDLYERVNIRGDNKVDLSQIQPFIDYLMSHNFEPSKLRSIITSLAVREFAHIRELNYVKFCVFVRYVLQRYDV